MEKKKKTKKENEIFNFQDEIVIGINSPKALEEKKSKKTSSKKKKHKKKKKKNTVKREQNTKLKAVLKWTILIVLLIGAIIYFMMSPLFSIRQITIEGTSKISKTEIESLSQLATGQNIYNFSKMKTKKQIKENPYISTVNIKRQLPDKVLIQVTERVATFLVEFGNAYIYLDNQGYALEISEEKLELPILSSLSIETSEFKPGTRLGKTDLVKLEEVITIISATKSNELYERVAKVDLADADNYTLTMDDNKIVYIGDTTNLNVKMLYLKKIMEEEEGIEGEVFLDGKNYKEVFFREKI